MSYGMDHLISCAHHTVKEVTHECPAQPHLQSKGGQIWEAAGHDVPCQGHSFSFGVMELF